MKKYAVTVLYSFRDVDLNTCFEAITMLLQDTSDIEAGITAINIIEADRRVDYRFNKGCVLEYRKHKKFIENFDSSKVVRFDAIEIKDSNFIG